MSILTREFLLSSLQSQPLKLKPLMILFSLRARRRSHLRLCVKLLSLYWDNPVCQTLQILSSNTWKQIIFNPNQTIVFSFWKIVFFYMKLDRKKYHNYYHRLIITIPLLTKSYLCDTFWQSQRGFVYFDTIFRLKSQLNEYLISGSNLVCLC